MKSWVQDQDIKLLRIFHTVAKSGGFAQAQVQLNLSQSSVSTYMSQLETRIGLPLCTRGHAGFALTDEGRAILQEIETLFEALEGFATRVAETKAELVGDLYFGVIESSVTHPDQRIVGAIASFREDAPNVAINIYAGGALELEDRVLDGRLHAAMGIFPHEVDGLEYKPLFDEQHHLYCAKGHPLFDAQTAELTIQRIAEHSYASRDYVDLTKGLEPPEELQNVASAPHMEGLLYLALTGKYVVYLPDHTAKQWLDRNILRKLDIPGTQRVAKFQLITKKGKHRSRLLNKFLAQLED